MKVIVAYTAVVTKIIKVDDKFSILSMEDPGYQDLGYTEEQNLMAELISVSAIQVGCCACDINDICDAETDEVLAEV